MRLDLILGSKNRVKVLRGLLKRDSVCGREAGRAVELSASAANIALGELVDAGIVFRNGTPGKHLYELNRGHYLMPAIERLFDAEHQLASKVSDLVRKHLNDLKPRSELMGLGIRDTEVALVLRPLIPAEDARLRSLSIALRAEFGLTVDKVAAELSSLSGYSDVRLAVPGRQSDRSSNDTRDRTLSFFGLSKAKALRRQGEG